MGARVPRLTTRPTVVTHNQRILKLGPETQHNVARRWDGWVWSDGSTPTAAEASSRW